MWSSLSRLLLPTLLLGCCWARQTSLLEAIQVREGSELSQQVDRSARPPGPRVIAWSLCGRCSRCQPPAGFELPMQRHPTSTSALTSKCPEARARAFTAL